MRRRLRVFGRWPASWSRPVHYLLLLLVQAGLLWPWWGAGGFDWQLSFHPLADALRLVLLKYHQFPWWNPWALGGTPLFADPEVAVISLDTLLALLFGAVLGPKTAVFLYSIVCYEGTRALIECRMAAQDQVAPVEIRPSPCDVRFLRWMSVVPALLPALAANLAHGHYSFVTFAFFPWLLLLGLTWRRGVRRSLALGAVAGYVLLTYPHYMTLMSLMIVAPVILWGLLRRPRTSRAWGLLLLAGSTALALCFTRLALAADWILRTPRVDTEYPLVIGWRRGLASLVAPFRAGSDAAVPITPGLLGWWEVEAYVGVLALVLAVVGLRERGRWRVRGWHVAAPLFLALAWGNEAVFCPSHWLRVAPPFSWLTIITRWRLFACYFILLAAVSGVMVLRRAGRPRLATVLGCLLMADLGVNTALAWYGKFRHAPPTWTNNWTAAPVSTHTTHDRYWQHLRQNQAALKAVVPALGYDPDTARLPDWDENYRGEFWAVHPGKGMGTLTVGSPSPSLVTVETWSPNRIVLRAAPGDLVTLNVNPGNYWLVNGARRFPDARPVEPTWPFQLPARSNGRNAPAERVTLDLRIAPPHLRALLLVQVCCAVLALALSWRLGRRQLPLDAPSASARV
jgi:hypothetical protein